MSKSELWLKYAKLDNEQIQSAAKDLSEMIDRFNMAAFLVINQKDELLAKEADVKRIAKENGITMEVLQQSLLLKIWNENKEQSGE